MPYKTVSQAINVGGKPTAYLAIILDEQRAFLVQSQSSPGEWHPVSIHEVEGEDELTELHCDCVGFFHKGTCSHTDVALAIAYPTRTKKATDVTVEQGEVAEPPIPMMRNAQLADELPDRIPSPIPHAPPFWHDPRDESSD